MNKIDLTTQQRIWQFLSLDEGSRILQRHSGVVCGFEDGSLVLCEPTGEPKFTDDGDLLTTTIPFDVPEHWVILKEVSYQ